MTKYKLILGDALEILPTLPSSHFQLILTDPPYFDKVRAKKRMFSNLSLEQSPLLVSEFQRVLKDGGFLVLFVGMKDKYLWYPELTKKLKYVTDFAWVYPNSMKPKYIRQPFWSSWEMATIFSKGKGNFNDSMRTPLNWIEIPAINGVVRFKDPYLSNLPSGTIPKPIELGDLFVRRLTREGDWILDPFMGSGSFIVSAIRNGRNAIGIEIDQSIYNWVERRLKDVKKQTTLGVDI